MKKMEEPDIHAKAKYESCLLITDLDGTLLNKKKEISRENQKAIADFLKEGGRFSVATGRSPASARRWLEQLPVNYPCIFYNGSMVKNIVKNKVLDCEYLKREEFVSLIEWVLANNQKTVVEIFTDQGLYVVSDPANVDPYLQDEKDPFVEEDFVKVKELEWIKILLCDTHEHLERVDKQLAERKLEKFCDYFYSQDFFLEITPKNHTKGSALRFIRNGCGENNLKIIAVGDYENDVGMIREADFGVAMGNAQEMVKAAADYVTVDNDSNPIEDILKKLAQSRF